MLQSFLMRKVVLITGSSSGIGKATVELFASRGWQVAATMRDPLKMSFSKLNNVKSYELDVTDDRQVRSVFKQVEKDFGSIDVVVNNAGYGLDGVFEAISDEKIKKQFDTNVFGLMRVTRMAIEHMRPKKVGTIVQISSMGGRVTFPLYSIYHSTKWAVEGFSESLQYELNQFGVRIKIVEPGVIKTDFYGKNRVFAKPKERIGYDSLISKVERLSMSSGKNGVSPKIVANTIYKAAISNSNKLRYTSGNPAPLLVYIKKIIPERLFFKVIRNRFKA